MNDNGAGLDPDCHPADKWLKFAIGLAFIKMLVVSTMYIDGATPSDVVRLGLVNVVVLWWLTIMVGRHKNWARYALLVLAVGYIPFGIQSFLKLEDIAYRLASIAESIAFVGGVGMLFGRQYKEWFSDPTLSMTRYSYQEIDAAESESLVKAEDAVPSDAADISPQAITEIEVEPDEGYKGWSFWQWAIAFCIMVFIFSAEGMKVRNSNDQGFLYGVIALQSIAGSVAVRVVFGAFHSRFSWRNIFRIAVIAAMAYLLLGLTLCSHMARHGWGGG